jgi:phosphatidylglycerol:prolipoprotein diacylglycerol transferase
MSIDQYGLHLGPLYLRFYGVILMLGVVAAAYLAERLAQRRKVNPEFLWDSLLWIVIAGIVGARLWHIFTPSPSLVAAGITTQYYLTHPLDAINLLRGGLGIPGAVIGGVLVLYILAKRRGENFLVWIDILAPAIALGQAIGRWGNYVNQELYGPPSTLPWAITIAPEHRLPEFAEFATYHPIFLYESLWSLASMFFLIWVGRTYSKRLKDGDIFLLYLITYPIIRILLEFLRLDSSQVAGFNANQTFMAVILVAALGALIYRHRPGALKETKKPAKRKK